MHRLVNAAAVAALALTSNPPAHAAAAGVYVYDTVDAIETAGAAFKITGILAGDSAPSATAFTPATTTSSDVADRCERFALLAMTKPGKYRFSVEAVGNWASNCKLALRTP